MESRACDGKAEIGYQIGILLSEKCGRFSLCSVILFSTRRACPMANSEGIFSPQTLICAEMLLWELPANAKKGAARKSAKTNGFIAEYSGFSTMARFNFAHTALI